MTMQKKKKKGEKKTIQANAFFFSLFFFFSNTTLKMEVTLKLKEKKKDFVPVQGTFRCEVPCHRQEGGPQS